MDRGGDQKRRDSRDHKKNKPRPPHLTPGSGAPALQRSLFAINLLLACYLYVLFFNLLLSRDNKRPLESNIAQGNFHLNSQTEDFVLFLFNTHADSHRV